MRKLIYTNADGNSITIYNTAPFFLQNISGFEAPKNNIYTTKSVNQDGATATGSSLDMSERTITGAMKAATNDALETRRRTLSKIFTPKSNGTLRYICSDIDKICNCKVETIKFGEVKARTQPFDVVLLCPNPFWQDIEESRQDIALWIGGIEFDETNGLQIDNTDGIEMGYRSQSLIVNVSNSGDVPCGMRIVFSALGSVENPYLLNVNTQEYFKIAKTMEAGEIITVTTGFGNKKVVDYLNGTTSTVLSIDLASTFLQLAVGDNLYRYNADSGVDNLECRIYYSPQYLGV